MSNAAGKGLLRQTVDRKEQNEGLRLSGGAEKAGDSEFAGTSQKEKGEVAAKREEDDQQTGQAAYYRSSLCGFRTFC
jgi:hypothetical protein